MVSLKGGKVPLRLRVHIPLNFPPHSSPPSAIIPPPPMGRRLEWVPEDTDLGGGSGREGVREIDRRVYDEVWGNRSKGVHDMTY